MRTYFGTTRLLGKIVTDVIRSKWRGERRQDGQECPSYERTTQFETFEDRLALSAQAIAALGDFRLEDLDRRIEAHGEIAPAAGEAHQLTGVTYERNTYGLRGGGQTVAVIDSGIAWDHVALGGGLGTNYRVVGGWDFTEENDANPYDDGPAGFHGTHVAGIIGSSDATYSGVSPDVDLVALRVFNDQGAGYFQWVEKALQWVHTNRNGFENPITTVNLSIGTDWNSNTIPNWTTLEDEFKQLHDDGIFVAVSAGNSFQNYGTPGVSYPAASPWVVPVASVDNDGTLSYFSQRNSRVLAAPGRNITSTVPDYVFGADGIKNDFGSASGTSMASPYVAGTAVLVREAMQMVGRTGISQDTIYDHLYQTSDLVYDSLTNANYHRINVGRALDSIIPADEYGSTSSTAYDLGSLGSSRQIAGLIGKLTDADYFRFTAGQTGTVTINATTNHDLRTNWTLVGGGGQVSGNRGQTFSFQVVAGQSYTLGLSGQNQIGAYTLNVGLESSSPTLTTTTAALSYTENAAATRIDPGLTLTGPTTASGSYSATVAITGGFDANQDRLAFANTAKIQGQISGGTLTLSVVAGQTATRADFEAALRGVTYQNISENPTTAARMVTFTFRDGTQDLAGRREIRVTAVNDAPTIATSLGNVSYTKREAVVIDSALRLADVDNSAASNAFRATVRISSGTTTGDQLAFANTSKIAGSLSNGVLSLNVASGQTATLADFEAALRSVTYRFASDAASTSSRVVSFIFNDGQLESTATRQVDVQLAAVTAPAPAPITSADWGQIEFKQVADQRISNGQQFTLTAGRAGTLTVEAFFAHAGGNVNLELYNSQNQRVGASGGVGNSERIDVTAKAGQTFTLKVQGANADVDFRLTNLVVQTSKTVDVFGTAGSDSFTFTAAASHQITVNGVHYSFATSAVNTLRFTGSDGLDSARLTGGSQSESLYLQSGSAMLSCSVYKVNVSGTESITAVGNGSDKAFLNDSAGDDVLTATPTEIRMTGVGFNNVALGFGNVTVYGSTGNDVATLRDSAGADKFMGRSDSSSLSGNGFNNTIRGFDRVDAFASVGDDSAYLYDSTGDDWLTAGAASSVLSGTGFANSATGFDRVYAYASSGFDRASFRDATTNQFATGSGAATLTGTGVYVAAKGFDQYTSDATASKAAVSGPESRPQQATGISVGIPLANQRQSLRPSTSAERVEQAVFHSVGAGDSFFLPSTSARRATTTADSLSSTRHDAGRTELAALDFVLAALQKLTAD